MTGRVIVIALLLGLLAGCDADRQAYNQALKSYYASDFQAAAQKLSTLARQDYAPAQFNLGIMYLNGIGVARSPDAGVNWLKKSDRQNYFPAKFYLSTLFLTGAHVRPDLERSFEGFRSLAESGYPMAEFQMAVFYSQGPLHDPGTMKYWLERSAQQGFEPALNQLVQIYTKGVPGIAPDPERVKYWRERQQPKALM